jgi:hypothetical protein
MKFRDFLEQSVNDMSRDEVLNHAIQFIANGEVEKPTLMARSCINVGIRYAENRDSTNAADIFIKAIGIYEALSNPEGISDGYTLLFSTYIERAEDEECTDEIIRDAKRVFEKAITMAFNADADTSKKQAILDLLSSFQEVCPDHKLISGAELDAYIEAVHRRVD